MNLVHSVSTVCFTIVAIKVLLYLDMLVRYSKSHQTHRFVCQTQYLLQQAANCWKIRFCQMFVGGVKTGHILIPCPKIMIILFILFSFLFCKCAQNYRSQMQSLKELKWWCHPKYRFKLESLFLSPTLSSKQLLPSTEHCLLRLVCQLALLLMADFL